MKYCIANNFGKGFITHGDSLAFKFQGYPCNIWVFEENIGFLDWIKKVNGIETTKDEAQALLDSEILRLQQEWDLTNSNVTEEELMEGRPGKIILP
jgi:hypothetical protein